VEKMLFAVVPAQNEQGRIGSVLTMLKKTSINKIITVVNGSMDNTFSEIKALKIPNIEILYFKSELGIDVPRAIGAYAAYKEGAEAIIFIDGDMTGPISKNINDLISAVEHQGVDLALSNCYSSLPYASNLARRVMAYRKILNISLGIYQKIGVATPSHGPHAVSHRLLEQIDFTYFAVPPMVLAFSVKKGLKVEVATSLEQSDLGSKIRGYSHAKKITDTIVGDTLEALHYFNDKPRSRTFGNQEFQGYNPYRRFDLLEKYLGGSFH